MSVATLNLYKLTRDLWPQKSIYDEIFKHSAALGLARKDTNFAEKIRYIAVGISAPQGIASTFQDAKQYKTPSTAQEFQIQTGTYHGTFSIDGVLYRRAKKTGNKALIVDPLVRESRNLMNQIKNDLSSFIYGDGVGALGRMTAASTPTSSATITLRNAADVRKFDKGMALQTEATGATGGTINPGYVTVNSIGGTSTAPTITVDQTNWATGIPAVAASDYLYRAGTYDAAPLKGFDAWLPSHSGSPGTFLGVNRNLYANKLAGQTLDGTTMSPRQRILRAARMVADVGGTADLYLMSTSGWEKLHNELQSAGMLRFSKVPAASVGKYSVGVKYDAIEMIGPSGPIQIFADPWCPDDVERCGQKDTMVLASTGDLVSWVEGASSGDPRLEDASDAYEVRAVGDMAFYIEAPWYWTRVSVTA